jgi:hypothetical protein
MAGNASAMPAAHSQTAKIFLTDNRIVPAAPTEQFV